MSRSMGALRIVNRLRLFGFALVSFCHGALFALLPVEQLDWLVVSFGVHAFAVFAVFAASPLVARPLLIEPLRRVDAFIGHVRSGRFDAFLPVRTEHGDETEASEFNRLNQSLNWMARQIELREARVREECERAVSLQRELREMVVRDPLTRIHNRLYFQEEVAAARADLMERGRSLTLAIVDVDHFKSINDTHGHQAGDRVLIDLARRMRRSARDEDVVARVGGEEFGILLRGLDATTAERILERLRAAVRETPFPLDDGEILHVTVSMGYVSVETPPENASRDDLVRRADEALYHVKRNGRDGLVNWDNIGGCVDPV